MKKSLLLIVALLVAGGLFAQSTQETRKGYIGIALGPAFPLGDIEKDAISGSAQLNLVNFGYLLSENVGIAAKWFGTSFVSKYDSDSSIGLGGLVAGLLFSGKSKNEIVEFDFVPMIGFGSGSVIHDGRSISSKTSAVFCLSTAMRVNAGRRISLSVGADYLISKPEGVDMSSLGVLFGINYRLK